MAGTSCAEVEVTPGTLQPADSMLHWEQSRPAGQQLKQNTTDTWQVNRQGGLQPGTGHAAPPQTQSTEESAILADFKVRAETVISSCSLALTCFGRAA